MYPYQIAIVLSLAVIMCLCVVRLFKKALKTDTKAFSTTFAEMFVSIMVVAILTVFIVSMTIELNDFRKGGPQYEKVTETFYRLK